MKISFDNFDKIPEYFEKNLEKISDKFRVNFFVKYGNV